MPVAVVTGSGGLVGSEAVRHFAEAGSDVIGIDQPEYDLRAIPQEIHDVNAERWLATV